LERTLRTFTIDKVRYPNLLKADLSECSAENAGDHTTRAIDAESPV